MGVKILHRQLAHAVERRFPQVVGHALTHLDELRGDDVVQGRGTGVAGQHPAGIPQDPGKIHTAGLCAYGIHRPAGQHGCCQCQKVGGYHQNYQQHQSGAIGTQEPGQPPQKGLFHPLAPPICSSVIRR